MRNRTGTFLLLAFLLAGISLLQRNSNACEAAADHGSFFSIFGADSDSSDIPCTDQRTKTPAWVYGMNVIAIILLAAGTYSGFQAYRERQEERDLLRGAGIQVDEQDLPLDV